MNQEWQLSSELIHLNHAAVGPWPERTRVAINQFAEQNTHYGSLHYPQWLQKEAELRTQLQQLINANSHEEIALLKNTSEALSVVAYGLDWQAGDNIVISNQEFPSNYIVWESLKPLGVEVRYADLSTHDSPEDALIALCDSNTRLLSISSVQYASGLRMNLNRLGEHCKSKNIFFCVDAIQSIGAEVFDVQACQADFVMADGHKWMLGPEGLALFYCRQDVMDKLKLKQYGWHMVENYLNFDDKNWQVANSARRFECGSPNMLCIHALSASVSLLLEIGMQQVSNQLQQKLNFLHEQLPHINHINVHSDSALERRVGIISFESEKIPSEELFSYLKKQQVFCAMRAGKLRFSPHYYTADQQLQQVVDILKSLSN